MSADCRLGRIEYDGARYCHEHGGFLEPGVMSLQCARAPSLIPSPAGTREPVGEAPSSAVGAWGSASAAEVDASPP